MPIKALLRTAVITLFVATAAHAQTLAQTLSGCNGVAPLRTVETDPDNYWDDMQTLAPGDRLLLAPGDYELGLPLHDLHGEPGKCIVIEGPATGTPARFRGSNAFNVISLSNASYITLRSLTLDGEGKAATASRPKSRPRPCTTS